MAALRAMAMVVVVVLLLLDLRSPAHRVVNLR